MTEDDSKEVNLGSEVGTCLKGSRMKKPVPPPMSVLILYDALYKRYCFQAIFLCLSVYVFLMFI